MKIILAGYREWALNTFNAVIESYPHIDFTVVKSHKELLNARKSIILCAGWSWIFKSDFIEKNEIICLMHPSDLPDYAGGSPIQNQVIEGVTETKATLFKADEHIDTGPIIKKVPISLEGDITQIYKELERATIYLFSYFLENYPKIEFKDQVVEKVYKRLTPKQSMLTKLQVKKMSIKEIYNFIRCRTDPYPNVYLEDDTGRIYFEKVRFEKRGENDFE